MNERRDPLRRPVDPDHAAFRTVPHPIVVGIGASAGGLACTRAAGIEAIKPAGGSRLGRGIAEHQLERVFDPFMQVNRNVKSVGVEGIGLGLAISRELARRPGGDITARSALSEGSTFALTLPRAG